MEKTEKNNSLSLKDVCKELFISEATGKNWLRLGKLIPNKGETIHFTREYIDSLKLYLKNCDENKLKSRRNKGFISGFSSYSNYLPENSVSKTKIQNLVFQIAAKGIKPTSDEINVIVGIYAEKLLKQRIPSHYDEFRYLVDDLTEDIPEKNKIIEKYKNYLNEKIEYENNHDILGFLYISLLDSNVKKNTGTYFTPAKVVNIIMKMNKFSTCQNKKLLDPCCGTGNFLLNIPDIFFPENIYGYDISTTAIKIARTNIALKFLISDRNYLYTHFKVKDYLSYEKQEEFDFIVGNPPWGTEYDYDPFVIDAIKNLKLNGVLSFVLPQSILNVKKHQNTRKFILSNGTLTHTIFLGEVFKNINCPSIIMNVEKIKAKKTVHISFQDKSFESSQELLSDESFIFLDSTEYEIVKKMEQVGKRFTLKGNCDFALGIVTGDNKNFIGEKGDSNWEPILRGTELKPFTYAAPKKFIQYKPEKFQQVAPEKYYRATEKIIYRFISKSPVFAYDNTGTLTLNSCNIMIPKMPGYSVKYILGILNSSLATWYFQKKFNSVKMLRSHIEVFPFPEADKEQQNVIIEIAEKFIEKRANQEDKTLLDKSVSALYGF